MCPVTAKFFCSFAATRCTSPGPTTGHRFELFSHSFQESGPLRRMDGCGRRLNGGRSASDKLTGISESSPALKFSSHDLDPEAELGLPALSSSV